MVLLSTPKSGGMAVAPSATVSNLVTASGILGLLFVFRTWMFHILDVALAWCRGLPAMREKNVYLQGAPRASQGCFLVHRPPLCLYQSAKHTKFCCCRSVRAHR